MFTLTGRLLAGTLRDGEEQVSRRDILVVDARTRLRTDLPLIPAGCTHQQFREDKFSDLVSLVVLDA